MFLKYVKLRDAIWPVSTFSGKTILLDDICKISVCRTLYNFPCDMSFIFTVSNSKVGQLCCI